MVLKDFREGFHDRADTSAIDLVLYFSEESAGPGRRLHQVLLETLPEIRFEVFTDFEELVTGLKRPEAEPAVVVLVINGRDEMEEFLPLRPVLQNTRVVLVLPEENGEINALARRLDPYYKKSADDDLVDLATIINEILRERRISSTGGQTLPPKFNL